MVARFGFGSDIHIGRSSGVYGTALEKFNHALQTYASLNVDAVGFSGDLTNNGKSSEYAELMNAISTNLPSSDKVILSMGNHETYDPGMAQASARFKSATGQDMNKLTSVNGIDVITLGPQNSDSDYRADYDFLHTALDSISSRQGYDPAQPIIVLTHHAVQNTAYVSNEWHGNYGEGSGQDLVALMQQYPQIIQVSGHSHATLEDARSIDQTLGYTSIQDGTIGAYFENESGKVDPSSGDGATRPADSELSSQGIIVDIHRDGTTEVHRLNFATGTWIYPQEPWIFSAAEARNDKYGKNRSSSPAVFAHDATVGFDTSATSTTKAVVTFPSAQAADDTNNNMVHSYAITLTPASGGEAVKKSVFSDYYLRGQGHVRHHSHQERPVVRHHQGTAVRHHLYREGRSAHILPGAERPARRFDWQRRIDGHDDRGAGSGSQTDSRRQLRARECRRPLSACLRQTRHRFRNR